MSAEETMEACCGTVPPSLTVDDTILFKCLERIFMFSFGNLYAAAFVRGADSNAPFYTGRTRPRSKCLGPELIFAPFDKENPGGSPYWINGLTRAILGDDIYPMQINRCKWKLGRYNSKEVIPASKLTFATYPCDQEMQLSTTSIVRTAILQKYGTDTIRYTTNSSDTTELYLPFLIGRSNLFRILHEQDQLLNPDGTLNLDFSTLADQEFETPSKGAILAIDALEAVLLSLSQPLFVYSGSPLSYIQACLYFQSDFALLVVPFLNSVQDESWLMTLDYLESSVGPAHPVVAMMITVASSEFYDLSVSHLAKLTLSSQDACHPLCVNPSLTEETACWVTLNEGFWTKDHRSDYRCLQNKRTSTANDIRPSRVANYTTSTLLKIAAYQDARELVKAMTSPKPRCLECNGYFDGMKNSIAEFVTLVCCGGHMHRACFHSKADHWECPRCFDHYAHHWHKKVKVMLDLPHTIELISVFTQPYYIGFETPAHPSPRMHICNHNVTSVEERDNY